MASDFGFIRDVKDSDFNEKLKDLYEECLKIVSFQTKYPVDCVMNIRTQNERLVKYLYTRLTGKRKENTFDILKDAEFRAAVNNATLINSADRLRFDGNLVVHPNDHDPVPIDAVMAAEIGVPTFVCVVRRICEIVDTLPPVPVSGAKKPAKQRPLIKGGISPNPAAEPTEKIDATRDGAAGMSVQNKVLHPPEQASDPSSQTAPPSWPEPLPLARTAVYPLPPSDAPKLFDPINGLVHYFIRPNDEFVLNSLERIGADACLYRLLKREGFARVAFLEVEHEEWLMNTYDGYSKGTVNVKNLKRQFSQEMRKTLEDKKHKTAVVIPLSSFEWGSRFKNDMIDAISKIGAKNGENILVLTTTYRTDITRCFAEQIWRVHGWLPEGVEAAEKKSAEVIQGLQERHLIVLADEYHADEIANLLLRKKLVEGANGLRDIPASKIYELAGLLLNHCLQIQNHFRQIPYQNRRDSCIRQLNALLDDTRVQEELAAAAEKLEPSGVGHSDQLDSLFLERLYHVDGKRYKRRAPAASRKAFPAKRQKKLPRDLFKNLPLPYQPEERKSEALKSLAEPAVLYIKADLCCGTGFLIHPDGYALTCHHVVRNARQVEARLRTVVSGDYVDIWYPCEVIYGEPSCDMAVLRLCEAGIRSGIPQAGQFPYLLMSSESRAIVYGEKYIMPGFPLGDETANDMTILDGKIANSEPDRQRDQMNLERCILNGRAIEGNSGSPIISLKDSRVIGLLVGAIGGTQGLDFMRPIKYFWRDFLR